MGRRPSCLAVVAGLALSGCSAAADFHGPRRVYGGTRQTFEYVTLSDGPWRKHQGWKLGVFYPVLAPALVVDLPLTLVADTVLLPATLFRALRGR